MTDEFVDLRAAIAQDRNRLTDLLVRVERQQKLHPNAAGNEELHALIATIKSAIDDLELALSNERET